MNRRAFLTYTAGVVAAPALVDAPRRPRVEVLHLPDCCLGESLAGFRSVVPDMARATRRSVVIVPAAGEIPPAAVRAIVTSLQAGAIVLLESGAGFADTRVCCAQREILRDCFQVHVTAPTHLWPRRTPYIELTWPAPVKLRDFSRVIPLDQPTDQTIGFADGLPVALRRQIGRGIFIFVGSPLGPALWAGDPDAKRWLLDVVRS